MIPALHNLYNLLKTAPMKTADFCDRLQNTIGTDSGLGFGVGDDCGTTLELLKACGFPLGQEADNVFLSTTTTLWREQAFCFVDIETTGSKPEDSSIIEIGAAKYQGGEIVGKFESFVYASEIPEKITELTGIATQDIQDAPKSVKVLARFKEFLGDSVFVAHNVNFDYSFISHHMDAIGLYGLGNPRICTIDLARKSILSPRYSLGFLNTFLGINTPVLHRAYADALSALKVFEICLYALPFWVTSTQDLIDFSKGKSKKPAHIQSRNTFSI
ncbi:3'-5' exonuclease [Helicobacter sp. 11S02596-1]|uniref:3'-5' exonuclease n=1 Tax=Helicobacter sp. 11S02596-1 TaxID=1476194 RepID=UPI000BCD7F01|nr:3'-5' exonuclease [Helicobacter sp. 11S02596-1]PAF44786.1 hypothetical protein BJI48_02010 [Helicobacter sp. 11S02596-1]